jgi:choline kinase
MRYVIMANGKGKRWGNYGGIPKHLIKVGGETLLERTTRLVHECDGGAQVIISSSNPAYEVQGAVRHAPERGEREIDRFCYELIQDDTCFLYGDAFYTPDAMRQIVDTQVEGVGFFGSERSIVAVKVADGMLMRQAIDHLIELVQTGELPDAKGWHLYHHLQGMPLEGKAIGSNFVTVGDATMDFNRPEDWEAFEARQSQQ